MHHPLQSEPNLNQHHQEDASAQAKQKAQWIKAPWQWLERNGICTWSALSPQCRNCEARARLPKVVAPPVIASMRQIFSSINIQDIYIYVCVCKCICICICVCICICTCLYICKYIYIYIYSVHVCVYVYRYICVYIYTHRFTYIHMHMHMHIHPTRTRTHIQRHFHIHIHKVYTCICTYIYNVPSTTTKKTWHNVTIQNVTNYALPPHLLLPSRHAQFIYVTSKGASAVT